MEAFAIAPLKQFAQSCVSPPRAAALVALKERLNAFFPNSSHRRIDDLAEAFSNLPDGDRKTVLDMRLKGKGYDALARRLQVSRDRAIEIFDAAIQQFEEQKLLPQKTNFLAELYASNDLARVRVLLAFLRPGQSRVLTAKALGLSSKEIGERLGLSEGAVRAAAHKGIKNLDHLLAEDKEGESPRRNGFVPGMGASGKPKIDVFAEYPSSDPVRLRAALAKLSDLDQRIVRLREEGWSFQEVGEKTGISQGNARVRLFRVMAELKRERALRR